MSNSIDWDKKISDYLNKSGLVDTCAPKNKGEEFELLIQVFLDDYYNGKLQFHATKSSHDGSKDFWAVHENKLYWAECKNYTPNIDLKVLASTLFMSNLYDVDTLLFFSTSNLIDNLKLKISQYSDKFNKEVFIFENEELYRLLLKTNILSNTVTDDNCNQPAAEQISKSIILRNFYEKSINSYKNCNFDGYYDIKNLKMNEVYYLYSFIYNTDVDNVHEVELVLVQHDDLPYFEILSNDNNTLSKNFQKTISVQPNQILLLKIPFRVLSYKNSLSLPELTISNQLTTTTPENKQRKHLPCIHSGRDIFIGKHYHDILNKFTEFSSCDTNAIIAVFYGTGGTGKTRMLHECYVSLIKQGYTVYNFTGFDIESSWRDVIREIAFMAFDIAFGYDIKDIQAKTLLSEFKDNYEAQKLLLEMIHVLSKNDFLFEDVERTILPLFYKLAQNKNAILIDNLQSYKGELVFFLKKLIQFQTTIQHESSFVILTTINTSLVYEIEVSDFLASVIERKSNYGNVKFLATEIIGFQNELQGVEFLVSLLRLKENEINPNFLRDILSTASLKPKYIEQVADYLISNECVQIKNNNGIILNSDNLIDKLKDIPTEFSVLFEHNYNAFINKNNGLTNEFKQIICLIYLFGEISYDLFDSEHKMQVAIQLLLKFNFIKETKRQDHTYVFEHDLIEKCFEKIIYPSIFEDSLKMLNILHSENKKYFIERNDICLLLNLYNDNHNIHLKNGQIAAICKIKKNINLHNRFTYKFYYYLVDSIIRHKEELAESFICKLTECANFIRDHISEVIAETLYDKAFPHIDGFAVHSQQDLSSQFSFIIHFCENKIRLKKVEQIVEIYNKYIQKYKRLKRLKPEISRELNYAIAYMNNRIFVCGKVINQPKKFYRNYRLCSMISLTSNFNDILFENYFDGANLFFTGGSDNKLGIVLLEKGFACYEKCSIKLRRKFEVNYYSKKILYNLLIGDTKFAIALIENALMDTEYNEYINYHIFFRRKFYRYKIIALLLNKDTSYILTNSINMYVQLMGITGEQDSFDIYYLQANFKLIQKNYGGFVTFFEKCCEIYHKQLLTHSSKATDKLSLENLAIQYRLHCSQDIFFIKLDDITLTDCEIFKILKMEQKDFYAFYEAYKFSAPILDTSGKTGYFC